MRPGEIISDRFEIIQEAGAGGMGAVYRAMDRARGQLVALKVLYPHALQGADRFAREAEALSELSHPGIVRYAAHGTTPWGARFLAMEWLDGEDLGDRLDRGPLSVAETLSLATRVASALGCAHGRGIVHRDIKPSNLFLPGGDLDQVKLLDFGIARMARDARKLTATGALVGTPGYMAPEQVQGVKEIGPPADVFSLGCVLFECLTGRAAFEGEHLLSLLAKILLQDAPRVSELVPGIPAPLDALVASMLAKKPADRPKDGEAVARAIEDLGRTRCTDEARAGPSPALTESETRVISVIVAGEVDPGEDMSPHARRTLAGELHAAVELQGGKLLPLADGSFVVSLSGSGEATDQAMRAARCALSLRRLFDGVPIAIATGRGLMGSRAIVGDVIDQGVRLLRATPRRTIRLCEMTAGLLEGHFEITQKDNATLLCGARSPLENARKLLGKVIPCVGRGRELSSLAGIYVGCTTEPVASCVLVTGAAGAGKSRLRQEFLAWLKERGEPARVLLGLGDSLSPGAPLGIIGPAIRRLAGIHDGEPLEARQEKIRAHVAPLLAPPDRDRVTVFLGELAGVPFPDTASKALNAARNSPMLMADAMRAAWEDFLEAECKRQPVVLVLEDLHWGDQASVSYVDSALRNLRDSPLMVLALARPDVHAEFPSLWSERDLQVLQLGPLTRKASEKLVKEALGKDVAPELLARIVERADGNAFYLEELVRAVAAGDTDVFPDTVIGMVQARLDAQGSEAKRVLRAASVLGERFTPRGVAALLGGDAHVAEVIESLERLASRELVVRAGTGPPTDEDYVFGHALAREAAYAMLTDEDRKLGHRLAGEWLESTGRGDAVTLAEHFHRGGELMRAARWYGRAAEQALEANDLVAALSRSDRGIALLGCDLQGDLLGSLRLVQAEAHVWRGELSLAVMRSREAASAMAKGSTAWFRALAQQVVATAKMGQLEDTKACILEATAHLPKDEEGKSAQIACLARAAEFLVLGARIPEADDLIARVDTLSQELAKEHCQVSALVREMHSIRATVKGDLGAGLRGLEAALVDYELAHDGRNACAIRSNLGSIYAELGDPERAVTALRSALAAADRMGLTDLAAVGNANLGLVLGRLGILDEAARLEKRAAEAFAAQGDARFEGAARTYLAQIDLLAGDPLAAENEARVAAERLEVARPLRAGALAVLARALQEQKRFDQALEASREAMEILDEVGGIEEGEALVRLVHAECLKVTGHVEEARTTIHAARDRLLARAQQISDRAFREQFLTHVPENARTLEMFRSLVQPSHALSA